MATKEDIIWFSDFLNQYDLGIRMTSYWNSVKAETRIRMDITNIEKSDNPKRFHDCSNKFDYDEFERNVLKEICLFGFIRVNTSLNPYDSNPNYREQNLHLPQAVSFKELKMKIELKGTVEYEDTEKTI